ncbi:MAG: hypothetical protein KJO31_02195 [Gammaproteobacteria bacterium]|nr:hypothetical protein [Gammaproteobacteria bacterium]
MNWSKASAIAEILSSVAIFVTLFYLAVEVQQNADSTQAETRQAILSADQEFLQFMIEEPDLVLLRYKTHLDDIERVRLSFQLLTLVRMREINWIQHQNGILDDVTWHAYLGSVRAVLSAPQSRVWWKNYGVERIFDVKFISLVDELLAETPVFERSPHITAFD